MAKHFGTNVDTEDTGMVAARKEFDEKKKALADAFGRKARALAEVEDLLGERSLPPLLYGQVSTSFVERLARIFRGTLRQLFSMDCFLHSFHSCP